MEPDPKYQGSLSQTRDEILAAGGRAVAVQADLSQSEERERLFAEVVNAVGAPDILVNNAGALGAQLNVPLLELDEATWHLMVRPGSVIPAVATSVTSPPWPTTRALSSSQTSRFPRSPTTATSPSSACARSSAQRTAEQ